MKIDLDFVNSIEHNVIKKQASSSGRTYYIHYIVFRGNKSTVTVQASSFLDISVNEKNE